MDHFWIILGPFCPLYFELNAHGLVHLWINFGKLDHSWTILPTAFSTKCPWSCALVDQFCNKNWWINYVTLCFH